jgi:hypothetical protein
LDEPKTRFITESNLSAPSIFDLSYPPVRSGRPTSLPGPTRPEVARTMAATIKSAKKAKIAHFRAS